MKRMQLIKSALVMGWALLLSGGLTAETISRIGFGSCLHQDEDQSAIWEAVVAEDPQLFILAGDNVYADTHDRGEFRARYEQLLAQPGFQALRAHLAEQGDGQRLLATYDDHDFGENDAGREYPLKEFAQSLLLESFDEPADSPRRDRDGVYGAWYYGEPGRRVQILLLDTRYHRSPLERYPEEGNGKSGAYKPVVDEDATLLGEEQWAWLEAALAEPAEVRLLVSSIQVLASEHRWEKWSNIPGERRRLLRLIEDSGAEGLLVLSGDRHHAELSRVVRGVPYPLYDFTSSGMTQSQARLPERPEPNRYRVGSVVWGHHFGMVEVDWERADPVIHLRIVGKERATLLEHRVLLSELQAGTEAVDSPQWRLPEQRDGLEWLVDGRLGDWKRGEYLRVEDGHLLARMAVPEAAGLPYTGHSLYWAVDTDDRSDTGQELRTGKGFEAALEMNRPRAGESRYSNDLALRWDGEREERPLRDFGFQMGPTFASRHFEVAFPMGEVAEWLDWEAGETLRVVGGLIRHADADLEILFEDRIGWDGEAEEAKEAVRIPAAPEDGLRVVSWNVLWGGPGEDADPYRRILRALDADVLLLQEWSRETVNAAEVENWFNRPLDDESTRYTAVVGGAPGWWNGTVLVTPHKVETALPGWNPLEAAGWDFPQRMAGGMVVTPVGRILAASIHYKAAGGEPGSREDERRAAEAAAVNQMLRGARAMSRPDGVLLGGDFNLIGQRRVLQKSLRNLDLDNSPLAVAQAGQLGRNGIMDTYTGYSPGSRLDYIGYSDSRWRLHRAFVLDSTLLGEEALREAGLERQDSETSDHLPVVIDLIPLR